MAWFDDYLDVNGARIDRGPPPIESLIPDYEMEGVDGLLMGQSAAAGATADPRTVEGQRYAMDRLGREAYLAGKGILTPGQRARYEQQAALAGQGARGARGALMEQQRVRGHGGADMELLAAQMGSQQDNQQRAQMDAQMQASLADRSRRLQGAYSDMAQNARQQSFGESQARGEAADRQSMFDTQYAQGAAQRNTDRRNEQSRRRAGANQQWWENYLNQRDPNREARHITRNFNNEQRDNQRQAQMWNSVIDTAGSVAGAATGSGLGGGGGGGGAVPSYGYLDDEDDED